MNNGGIPNSNFDLAYLNMMPLTTKLFIDTDFTVNLIKRTPQQGGKTTNTARIRRDIKQRRTESM
jgi:hypothetical protein